MILERHHRAQTQVENRIKKLKDTGLSGCRSPTATPTGRGLSWCCSQRLLLTALQALVDDPELAVAEPRRLRYTLLHIAARVVHRSRQTFVRLDRTWPWTGVLVAVHRRLDAMPTTSAC